MSHDLPKRRGNGEKSLRPGRVRIERTNGDLSTIVRPCCAALAKVSPSLAISATFRAVAEVERRRSMAQLEWTAACHVWDSCRMLERASAIVAGDRHEPWRGHQCRTVSPASHFCA